MPRRTPAFDGTMDVAPALQGSDVGLVRAKVRVTRQTLVRSLHELKASRQHLTGSAMQLRAQLHAIHELLSAMPPFVRPASRVAPPAPDTAPRWSRGKVVERVDTAARDGASARRSLRLRARLATLTARERDVMERVAAGKTSKQIAGELALSVRTVDGHRGRIFQKMGVSSAARLIASLLECVILPE